MIDLLLKVYCEGTDYSPSHRDCHLVLPSAPSGIELLATGTAGILSLPRIFYPRRGRSDET
ncbi:MAG: hypothetical protein DMG34_22225 [Acidobacteria bacterium]|nr:MAG: hypothetical protein DMG34_22225 [Acidobacteriota bacterium]